MKRLLTLVTALVMILTLAAAALAEGNNVLLQVADDCDKLLFSTDNVTLKGNMEFSFDGNWSKTIDGVYQQEGYDAYCDLKVKRPKKDGSVKNSGYTIFDDDGAVRVVEVVYPGTYKTAGSIKNNTILRSSARTDLVMGAFRMLAGMADVFAEVTVGTAENGGKTIHMKLNGNSTEIVNTGLMMLMQFAGDRFLRMNSDEYKSQTGKIGDYVSIARGVLATTQSMSIQNAEMTLKVNDKGELEAAEGSASVAEIHAVAEHLDRMAAHPGMPSAAQEALLAARDALLGRRVRNQHGRTGRRAGSGTVSGGVLFTVTAAAGVAVH